MVASDSDWDMMVLETGAANRERNERVLAASKSIAIKEPRIGRMLFGLFRDAGLTDVKVEIMAGADTAGRALPMLKASFSRYAHDSGRVAEAEVAAWLRLESSARSKREGFFSCCRSSWCAALRKVDGTARQCLLIGQE